MVKRVRIRHSGGASTIEVPVGSSAGDVARLIESATSISHLEQVWKVGYPPRPVAPLGGKDVFPLDNVDMIHVSVAATTAESPTIIEKLEPVMVKDDTTPEMIDPDGIIVRRVMDADNSCLFNSIAYVLLGQAGQKGTQPQQLRQMVAQAVRDDTQTFTAAFLGKDSPQDYIDFITRPDAWGGQIELLIFSRLFQTEIASFDIIRDHFDVYGTEEGYKRRVFVIYDGIHYDAMAFTFDESLPQDMDVTQFSPLDEVALDKARAVCAEQHRKKAFTDTSNFTLRCVVCQEGLMGAKEAQEHAHKTGHTNFAEFR